MNDLQVFLGFIAFVIFIYYVQDYLSKPINKEEYKFNNGVSPVPPADYNVTEKVAHEFAVGTITYQELSSVGISELGVKLADKDIRISWFRNGDVAKFAIDGQNYFSSADVEIILKAAKLRAAILADEGLEALSFDIERYNKFKKSIPDG